MGKKKMDEEKKEKKKIYMYCRRKITREKDSQRAEDTDGKE